MLVQRATRSAEALSIPQDIVDAIVDEVWDDDWPYCRRDLDSCSTVCSTMLNRSTKHLFTRVKVSSEDVSKLIKALRKSTRLRSAIGDLFIVGEEWPNLTQLPQEYIFSLLSLLPALSSLRLGWVYVYSPPAADMARPTVQPHLKSLRLDYVDWHTLDCVFYAVDGVDTVSMYGRFTDGDVHTPRSRAQVRAIELHTDPEIMEWAMDMFDPGSLRSMELDFHEEKRIRISAYAPFEPFLERYGANIEHLSFAMPSGGIYPEKEVESLTSCRNLHSLKLTTPRHNAWSSAYAVLRSLPPSVREIKMHLVADFDEYREDDEPDMSTFDWQGLDKMLAQCTELAVLDVNVVLVEEDRFWAVDDQQQKAIRAKVSQKIGRILRFV